jgi:Rrf2 family protein
MPLNSRFTVATHILTLLYEGGGGPLTSDYIAGSVNTNPAVIRRLLSVLAKAGLTTAQLGAGGGAMLARPAAEITLRDVYRAVDEGMLFAMHPQMPNPECPVGRHIQASLETTMEAAGRALEAELARHTIADLVDDVRRRERKRVRARGAAS